MAHHVVVEQSLRNRLIQKPQSAKAAAELSVYLSEKQQQQRCGEEALRLAHKAIALAPARPAGYAALSLASSDPTERLGALRRIADLWNPSCSMTTAAFAGTLVRLLLEPRDHESHESHTVGKASPRHPGRRALDRNETLLYERIVDALEKAWQDNQKDRHYLAKAEHRLGLLFRKMQPTETYQPFSRKHFQKVCQNLPHDDKLSRTARFWLATLSEEEECLVDRCPEEYVLSLYSSFAERFDHVLVNKLRYETPQKLRRLVDRVVVETTPWARWAVDLGCGTGLSGMAFCDCAQKLIGVDLSPEMLAKAAERTCYDDLRVCEVTRFLQTPNTAFDLVFACDVFVYLGDLHAVFAGVKERLTQHGVFCFSLEFLNNEDRGDFVLQTCARFAHKRSYVERLAAQMCFDIVALKVCPIRQNGGKDVMGMLVVARPK